MKVDFIIAGQGLAGTLLAYELFRLGKSFIVFDDPNLSSASDVAAGLINPVVFRRLTKSWMVDDVFPQMETTYRQLEGLLQEQFYFPNQIHRILGEGGIEFWKEKVFANHLKQYLEADPDIQFRHKNMNSPFGIGRVLKAGRLDIQKLISSFSKFLQRQNLLRKEKISFEKMVVKSDLVSYNDVAAEKIIFCEGPAVSQNPYFKNLKFKHSKGEILELKIPELNLKEIISQEVFVMPVGNDCYKVGATYSWDQLNGQTTDSAREELLEKLKNILTVNPEILGQKAGIRPTMHDRKPVIGFLPDSPQIGIFNGLGSKGVMLGPFFALQFADFLIGNKDFIHPEVNINRYFKSK